MNSREKKSQSRPSHSHFWQVPNKRERVPLSRISHTRLPQIASSLTQTLRDTIHTRTPNLSASRSSSARLRVKPLSHTGTHIGDRQDRQAGIDYTCRLGIISRDVSTITTHRLICTVLTAWSRTQWGRRQRRLMRAIIIYQWRYCVAAARRRSLGREPPVLVGILRRAYPDSSCLLSLLNSSALLLSIRSTFFTSSSSYPSQPLCTRHAATVYHLLLLLLLLLLCCAARDGQKGGHAGIYVRIYM